MAAGTPATDDTTNGADGAGPAATPAIGRRAAMAGAGAAVLGLTVAACGSSGGSSGGSGSGGRSSDLPEGAPGTVLGPVSDVPVGGGAVFADQQVVVTQPTAGRFQGLSSICPHQSCSVNEVRNGEVICPCHGSRFGLDGAVLEGPATTGLARRAVAVQGQNVTLA